MATKTVKVKAHKRLDGTGKIESVDAHIRKLTTDQKIRIAREAKRDEMQKESDRIGRVLSRNPSTKRPESMTTEQKIKIARASKMMNANKEFSKISKIVSRG